MKSKQIVSSSLISLFIALAMVDSALAIPRLMGLRHGEEALARYCSSRTCRMAQVETDAREFANGNTFVRFKESVAGQDIVIVVPKQVDFNQFMELLIKVRTAK